MFEVRRTGDIKEIELADRLNDRGRKPVKVLSIPRLATW